MHRPVDCARQQAPKEQLDASWDVIRIWLPSGAPCPLHISHPLCTHPGPFRHATGPFGCAPLHTDTGTRPHPTDAPRPFSTCRRHPRCALRVPSCAPAPAQPYASSSKPCQRASPPCAAPHHFPMPLSTLPLVACPRRSSTSCRLSTLCSLSMSRSLSMLRSLSTSCSLSTVCPSSTACPLSVQPPLSVPPHPRHTSSMARPSVTPSSHSGPSGSCRYMLVPLQLTAGVSSPHLVSPHCTDTHCRLCSC